ncbi:MAG TPA: sulfurtransferase TusA family protein [Candidatus Methanoperedenaceae archaeon]|nr:sulfurtransferase TusA family protein [Candidatus Methanoperedenaceae archaeon]
MQQIDARGRVCPLPLFYTKRKLEEMRAGEELVVLADDTTAKETIPKWCSLHGHDARLEDMGGYFRVVIRKR